MRKHLKTFLLVLLLLPVMFWAGCKQTTTAVKLTKEMVEISSTEVVYNGSEQKPSIIVSTNDEVIAPSEYTVSYSNNINIGTATITITAKDDSEKIKGSTSVNFQIIEKPEDTSAIELSSSMVFISSLEGDIFEYNGEKKTPVVRIITDKYGQVPSTEFSVTYENNITVGTASIFIKAKANSELIKGSVTKTFKIIPSRATVKTLARAQSALNDLNYSSVWLADDITIKSTERLTIKKNRTLYTDNNTIENNGVIVNEGEIVSNTQIKGTGIIENNGQISASVKNREELLKAVTFATHITLQRNISAYDEHNNATPIVIDASNKYCKFTLDLNGYNIESGLEFIAHNDNTSGSSNNSLNTIIATIKNSNIAISQIGSQIMTNGIKVVGDGHLNLTLNNIAVVGNTYGLYSDKSYSGGTITAQECSFTSTQTNNYLNNEHILGGCGVNLESNATYTFTNCNFTGLTGYYTRTGHHKLQYCNFTGTGSYCDYKYSSEGAYSDGSAIMTNKTTGCDQFLYVELYASSFYSEYSYGWHDIYTAPDGQALPKNPATLKTFDVDKVKNFSFGRSNQININFKSELNTGNDNIVWA